MIVLQALKILKASSIYPVIVFTSHTYDYRKPDYIDTILQTIHSCGLINQVYLLALIPRIDQIQLMRPSLAVIQPSLLEGCEGWSMVVEDARCLGKKMILSDFPVHLSRWALKNTTRLRNVNCLKAYIQSFSGTLHKFT